MKKVFNISYLSATGEHIDDTQVDELNDEMIWDLFKEFGHERKEGYYWELDEEVWEEDDTPHRIIPYTSEQLSYHLYNNFYPGYSDATIAQIIETCDEVNKGVLSIHDCIDGTEIPIWEMLNDMRIEYEEYPGQHS